MEVTMKDLFEKCIKYAAKTATELQHDKEAAATICSNVALAIATAGLASDTTTIVTEAVQAEEKAAAPVTSEVKPAKEDLEVKRQDVEPPAPVKAEVVEEAPAAPVEEKQVKDYYNDPVTGERKERPAIDPKTFTNVWTDEAKEYFAPERQYVNTLFHQIGDTMRQFVRDFFANEAATPKDINPLNIIALVEFLKQKQTEAQEAIA